MDSSGIIRRVDELGRIVIPVEIRRLMNIKVGENLEFLISKGEISLKKKSYIENNLSIINSFTFIVVAEPALTHHHP